MAVSKSSDSNLYNDASENFIPIACHYDEHTLLTKNGELLQTIQINGIHSEKISKNLFNLRKVVRESIRSTVTCKKFAFWVHTIRRKDDLDDDAEYNGLLSANIHDLWRSKNYWHDKFVNRLYITVVHQAPTLKLNNFNSLVHSLSVNTITSFEEKYFAAAAIELNNTVNGILEGVGEYGAQKLGIRIEGEECYSDPMFLYRRIMQLNEEDCPVPISDISAALGSHQYSVGSDKIEVIGNRGKKFAALMSIKEYKEVSAEALDKFLQIPVEMVATEVFYFVDRDEVVSVYEDQDYILGVSGDSELREFKGLDVIVDVDNDNIHFCHQQISFMVIGDDIQTLDKQVRQASDSLSKIGIVHVREDVNLEKTFWAQLPANFSFLTRMRPTVLKNTAALASLHNFPTGNQYNIWGRAVTLLRTEKGTPYFMNFHDQTNVGTTCIFGERKSGKTTLLNFLISEADKYNPTTIYLTDDMDSGLYIKARGGNWFQRDKNIINPLLCTDTEENRKFLFDFFKIIAKHYFDPLQKSELSLLQVLSESVFNIPIQERRLSKVIQTLKNSDKGEEELRKRLAVYLPEGIYHGVFERDNPINLSEGSIVAINLQCFDDAAYTKANYPKEKKLIEQFEYDRNVMRAVKAAIVLTSQNIMQEVGEGPKIFAVDNLSEIINLEHYAELFSLLAENITAMNGVFVSGINIDVLHKLYTQKIPQEWIARVNTSFILPSEITMAGIDEVLSLESAEFKKLSKLTISSRMFLIRQDGKSIASELSIGGLSGLIRLFCSGQKEIDIYKEVINEFGNKKPEDWVQEFYEKLENVR